MVLTKKSTLGLFFRSRCPLVRIMIMHWIWNKSPWFSVVDSNVNVNRTYKSPVRAAIASASMSMLASVLRFDGKHMICMQTGWLSGQLSLEEGCLNADGNGEDVGMSVSIGMFFFLPFFRMLTLSCVNRSPYTRILSSFCTNFAYGQLLEV